MWFLYAQTAKQQLGRHCCERQLLLGVHGWDQSSEEEGPRHVKKPGRHPAKAMHSASLTCNGPQMGDRVTPRTLTFTRAFH